MESKIVVVTKKNIEEVNQIGLPPSDDYYTLDKMELYKWLCRDSRFLATYTRWMESGYKLGYTPAIYFLDDEEGATIKNMRITIWRHFKNNHLPDHFNYTDLRILTYYNGEYLGCDNLGLWSTYKQIGLMQNGMLSNNNYDSTYVSEDEDVVE